MFSPMTVWGDAGVLFLVLSRPTFRLSRYLIIPRLDRSWVTSWSQGLMVKIFKFRE